jgi:hypothetical protein
VDGPPPTNMYYKENSYTTDVSNIEDHIFLYERKNPQMEYLLYSNTYLIKKKANYLERLLCGIITFDNVYKLYNWNEDLVESEERLIRYKQQSYSCIRNLCCSQLRSYRTTGEKSNKTGMLTKSIRPFRWNCPCNKSKAFT